MRLLTTSAFMTSVLLISACGNESADTDGDGKISKEEVAAEMKSVSLEPGNWENTVEFTAIEFDESKIPAEQRKIMDGMLKSMIGNKVTTSQCITEEQADNPQAEFFAANDDQDCEYSDFSMAGGNLLMKMTCTAPSGALATMSATGEYKKSSFTMNMDMQSDGGEIGEIQMKASVTGKRTGKCT